MIKIWRIYIFVILFALLFFSCGIMKHNSIIKKSIFEYNKKNYKIAVNYATDAIGIYPQKASNYYVRGLSFLFLYKYKKALADFTKALKFSKGARIAYFNRAVVYYFLGHYNKSRNDFLIYIKQFNNDAGAYFNVAKIYWEIGKYKKAFATCDYPIQCKFLGYDALYFLKSYFYFKQKLFAKALGQIDLAINISNHDKLIRDGKLYLLRGLIFRALGKGKKAIRDFKMSQNLLKDDKEMQFYIQVMSELETGSYKSFKDIVIIQHELEYN